MQFEKKFQNGDIWICKPSGRNQGKGIFLVTELSKLKSVLEKDDKKMGKSMIRIIQRYIMNPLLINGYKFDVRSYMLIGSTSPHSLVFYHDGYIRLSCVPYSSDHLDLHA